MKDMFMKQEGPRLLPAYKQPMTELSFGLFSEPAFVCSKIDIHGYGIDTENEL